MPNHYSAKSNVDDQGGTKSHFAYADVGDTRSMSMAPVYFTKNELATIAA